MGRLIDANVIEYFKSKIKDYDKDYAFSQEEVLNILERYEIKYAKSTIEVIPRDKYEARLKADMVAMLTDIQLEIEEIRLDRPLFSRGYECYGYEDKTVKDMREDCADIIQQKINALRGEEYEKENS